MVLSVGRERQAEGASYFDLKNTLARSVVLLFKKISDAPSGGHQKHPESSILSPNYLHKSA
jgi:hypothetical protein